MSLGYAARLGEVFPTPRAEDSESTGAHRGVPDTLTSYTRLRPAQMFCTPTVEDASRSGDEEMAQRWARGERVPDTHQRLRTQVLGSAESFPTPTVYDATGHGAPRAEQKDGSRHAVSLHHLAAGWPTPTSSMMTAGDMEQARYAGNSPKRPSYRDASVEWATPTAMTNRKSRRAMTASTDNGRRSGGGQSSPPALEQMVELAEGIIPKELEGIDPSCLPPATRALLPQTFPTPTAADGLGGPGNSGRDGGDNLRTVVSRYPTPTAMDAAGFRGSMMPGQTSEGQHWPTPKSRDWKGTDHGRDANDSGLRHGGDDLATSVDKRTWPTPMAGPANDPDGGGHGGVKLAEAATGEGPRGQLNPDWVEWLMGWPVGWTSTEPLPHEAFAEWSAGMVEAWWWGSEPPDVPRIAVGVKNRVPRLKAIGNGQVSLCAAWATLALFEMDWQVREATRLADAGPPTVDFLDLVDGF
jgi:hypothetical protein